MGGSSRGVNTATASMPADRIQAKTRNGKNTQIDSGTSMRHPCQKTWDGSVENGQQAKRISRSGSSFKKTARHRQDLIVYTDGSVTKGQSGWGFIVKQVATIIHEEDEVSTSILTMEMEVVTDALR